MGKISGSLTNARHKSVISLCAHYYRRRPFCASSWQLASVKGWWLSLTLCVSMVAQLRGAKRAAASYTRSRDRRAAMGGVSFGVKASMRPEGSI